MATESPKPARPGSTVKLNPVQALLRGLSAKFGGGAGKKKSKAKPKAKPNGKAPPAAEARPRKAKPGKAAAYGADVAGRAEAEEWAAEVLNLPLGAPPKAVRAAYEARRTVLIIANPKAEALVERLKTARDIMLAAAASPKSKPARRSDRQAATTRRFDLLGMLHLRRRVPAEPAEEAAPAEAAKPEPPRRAPPPPEPPQPEPRKAPPRAERSRFDPPRMAAARPAPPPPPPEPPPAAPTVARRRPRQRLGASMAAEEAWLVLGLRPGSSDADVALAHRRLMHIVHPDLGGTHELAARVNIARDTLLMPDD